MIGETNIGDIQGDIKDYISCRYTLNTTWGSGPCDSEIRFGDVVLQLILWKDNITKRNILHVDDEI
jgi:hypothetical protein